MYDKNCGFYAELIKYKIFDPRFESADLFLVLKELFYMNFYIRYCIGLDKYFWNKKNETKHEPNS